MSCSWKRTISRDICKKYGLEVVKETQQDPGIRVHCVSQLCLQCPANICLPNVCFSIFTCFVFLSFDIPNHNPNILFCLLLKMIFKVRISAILVSCSVFMCSFHICTLVNFDCLLLIDLMST